MKILVIEDEEAAASRLNRLVRELLPDAVIEVCSSVASSLKWISENPSPDLIIADINLGDGYSFEIFRQKNITSPVIFTTAYDDHAIEAFKFNSIDYLLKPVKKPELESALSKFRNFRPQHLPADLLRIMEQINNRSSLQKRILIRYGATIKTVEIADVAFFYTEEKLAWLCTFSNTRYPLDLTLDEIEKITDPSVFFRINRQFVINIKAIAGMSAYSKSRVRITLEPDPGIEAIVSSEKSPLFKEWLLGKS